MSIFNNATNIATNIGSNIVGSAVSKMVGNLTADEEEKSWMNQNGWFGSLIDAQKFI